MQPQAAHPRRILMTVDAVGGVWRYAMDLAAGLQPLEFETVFYCLGPKPSEAQLAEAREIGELILGDEPLDWMVEDESALKGVQHAVADVALRKGVDLVHLNLPSQAAGLDLPMPIVVVAHSCVCTWFHVVRGTPVPDAWQWQWKLNRQGFDRADAVLMPSRSHAELSRQVYGPIDRLGVIHNATQVPARAVEKVDQVFAAGRWWDEGKNGAVLDQAALGFDWPLLMAGADRGPGGQHLPLANADHRGALSHSETMRLMRKAAIVVSPSLYEPFGLVALEAARGASALVLADIPTYRELWDGAALFADPSDPDAFANAIRLLTQDPVLRRTLGKKAQERSLDFTVAAQAAAVSRLYQSLFASVPPMEARESA
jgi:glycosyltransferase involved in cell wall biosynthesis